MTKFSFEVPIKHLKDFEDLQDFNFSLSFLYKDKRYKKFMMRSSKDLWLDNSYNEKLKADDPYELVALAKDLGADKVIAPDDPKWSSRKLRESYQAVSSQITSDRTIVVAPDKTTARYLELIGVKHLAYSYWNRIHMSISNRAWAKNYHFLGMLEVEELTTLHPPSCDTSMPIKIALRGMNLSDWILGGCPHIYTHEMLDFFNMKLSKNIISLARTNIITLKEMVNGPKREA